MKPRTPVNAAALDCILNRATSILDKFPVPQWTTFDEASSLALRSRLPGATVVQLPNTSAIERALEHDGSVVAVLPASGLGQAGLAVFRWNRLPTTTEPPSRIPPAEAPNTAAATEVERISKGTRAAGLLGLSDEPVFEDEDESQEKKSWWKRFWED
jgi:hypothetical protein